MAKVACTAKDVFVMGKEGWVSQRSGETEVVLAVHITDVYESEDAAVKAGVKLRKVAALKPAEAPKVTSEVKTPVLKDK